MFFKRKIKKQKGFSLVELMVVIGIFAVISGVVLFNYGRFSSNLVVTNLAYQAAIAVREAQIYGISVKQASSTAGFSTPYGVWFSKDVNSGAGIQNFYLFADNPSKTGSKNIRESDMSEDEEAFGMSGSNRIKYFCVISSSGSFCSDSGKLDALSIIFRRPDANAHIYGFLGGAGVYNSVAGTDKEFDRAEIMFTSGQGDKTARMTVYNNGQISVDACDNGIKTCTTTP